MQIYSLPSQHLQKYEKEKLEKATQLLPFLNALISVALVFGINSVITSISVTSQENVLQLMYIGMNLLQVNIWQVYIWQVYIWQVYIWQIYIWQIYYTFGILIF